MAKGGLYESLIGASLGIEPRNVQVRVVCLTIKLKSEVAIHLASIINTSSI